MSRYLYRNISGFTIFELVISMTLFSVIMVSIFDSVGNIGFTRIRNMQRISLIEELYFFSEKLATLIKEGGTIDYEEYWGRMVMGTGIVDGHYGEKTYFGNFGYGFSTGASFDFGRGPYICRSGSGGISSAMGTGGCLSGFNSLIDGTIQDTDYRNTPQRYGQYQRQYTDANGNQDYDSAKPGDENNDGNILNDEDDIDLGDGPIVITNPMHELYLIDEIDMTRTFFRVRYRQDPDAPASTSCNTTTGSGGGCVGNIEILKLKGLDIGLNHDGSTGSTGFDGVIDTWVCHADWRCSGTGLVNGYGTISYGNDADWVSLFPDYINVKQLNFSIFPQKNPWYSWKARDNFSDPNFISPFIHPYVRIQLTLGFAWGRRAIIKNDDPTISLSTTLNLENYAH